MCVGVSLGVKLVSSLSSNAAKARGLGYLGLRCACCPRTPFFETEGRKEPFVQLVQVKAGVKGLKNSWRQRRTVGSGKRVEFMASEKNAEVVMGWLLCGRLLFLKGNV